MKGGQLIIAAVLAVYGVFILALYASGYPEIASAYEFSRFVFVVVGGRLLSVALLYLAAFGAGGFVFRRWLPAFGSLLEEFLVKSALGLVLISYAVFATGLAGLLYRPAGYLLLALCLALGAGGIRGYFGRLAKIKIQPALALPALLLAALSAYFLVKGLYGALLPPTGFDVLMYHLGVPRMYIDAHGIFPTPDINGSYFPFGVEMLYTLGMMVEGVITANLVNYSFAVVGGLAAYLFIRRFLPGASPLAGFAVYVSVPMVFWLMPQAYIELGQAAFTMLALYALFSALDKESGKGWLFVAGVLAGFTMAIKYTGILIAGIMCLVILLHKLLAEKEGARKALAASLVFLALCAAASAAWYLKNFVFYSNPVYPFMSGVFGTGGYGAEAAGQLDGFWSGGAAAVAGRYFSSLWTTTLDARAFQSDWGNGLGPVFLMFVPGALLFRDSPRQLRYLLGFCLLFFLAVITQRHVRYMAPIIPALSVLAAYPVGRLMEGARRVEKVLAAALVVVLVFAALMANSPRERVLDFPSASPEAAAGYYSGGPWSGYLASYDVWRWINANLPGDAVIYQLWDDASVYFRHRRTLGSPLPWGDTGRQRIHLISGVQGFGGFLPGEEIIKNLGEMGAGYLLINTNREGHAVPEDPYFQAHARLLLADKGVVLFQVVQ
ncbi:MAG TPA: glycosyltransferase family 39 protein [Nitrospirota bacterium]|nr:glycosyltransferase family 39 protein [Nitrospirota bacterium]